MEQMARLVVGGVCRLGNRIYDADHLIFAELGVNGIQFLEIKEY